MTQIELKITRDQLITAFRLYNHDTIHNPEKYKDKVTDTVECAEFQADHLIKLLLSIK